VQVGRETIRSSKQLREAIVHLGRLERAQTKPYARHVANELFDECRERRTGVAAVVPDVDTGEHDLRMPIGQVQRLVDERIGGTRARRPACQRRRTERTVLVAAVLNAEQRAAFRV
jgi:hypothetical protein